MSWGQLYALFCVETGWTWDYIDEEMTLPRSDGFLELWKQTPPLRTQISAICVMLGMPAPDSNEKPEARPADHRADLPSPDNRLNAGAYIEAFGTAGIPLTSKVSANG